MFLQFWICNSSFMLENRLAMVSLHRRWTSLFVLCLLAIKLITILGVWWIISIGVSVGAALPIVSVYVYDNTAGIDAVLKNKGVCCF